MADDGRLIDSHLRKELMDFFTAEQWNLIAHLFDTATFSGQAVENAVSVRRGLRELIQHPGFQRDLNGGAQPPSQQTRLPRHRRDDRNDYVDGYDDGYDDDGGYDDEEDDDRSYYEDRSQDRKPEPARSGGNGKRQQSGRQQSQQSGKRQQGKSGKRNRGGRGGRRRR